MVYIPYPRTDLDQHTDLQTWRGSPKPDGSWVHLKDFLAAQPRLIPDRDTIPKCWYTELPQGDDFALDVEHFRPKSRARPLDPGRISRLQAAAGVPFRQSAQEDAYPWLEFDYRNYRLTTAFTNRGGGKHDYFPLAEGAQRLAPGQFPWAVPEYAYLLDPADPLDAGLLLVLPDGTIVPSAPRTPLADADVQNLPASWRGNGFSYLRAMLTIQLYRLDHPRLTEARREKYACVSQTLETLRNALLEAGEASDTFKALVRDLALFVIPSAAFSLAARCAMQAYMPPGDLSPAHQAVLQSVPARILVDLDARVRQLAVSWDRP